ncbi:hypothetical protein IW261DRAFT_1422666 [Armillaria novae-zelandiae]|uniref:Uncharacterized protein n=1 Tax=Armillaria novae-zelandiae TaxID=153914 RepID=A0AA39NZM3_9AGAR|nr:hypothetical protein IW261DRAFT_1422666 [Armillaria novae-zelandiae]
MDYRDDGGWGEGRRNVNDEWNGYYKPGMAIDLENSQVVTLSVTRQVRQDSSLPTAAELIRADVRDRLPVRIAGGKKIIATLDANHDICSSERVSAFGAVKPDFALLAVFPVTTRNLEDLTANFETYDWKPTSSMVLYSGATPGG